MAACRVPPSCSRSSGGFVANRLAGARLHKLPGGRAVVPLLHPQEHGLPFLLTLELHSTPQPAGAATPATSSAAPQLDRSLYALHYVLAGSGQLVRSGGDAEELQAGDSVLMHSGAAACHAGASPGGSAGTDAGGPGSAGLPADSPWQLAELVAYMPRQLFEQAQQRQQQQQQKGRQQRGRQQQGQAEPAAWAQLLASASLQPLLLQQHAGSSGSGSGSGSSGVGSSESGSSSSEGAVSSLPAEFVGELLAGARDTARQLLLQQGHGPESQGHHTRSSISSARGSSSHGQRLRSLLRLPMLVRAAANSLSAWWAEQQQRTCPVTKRTLSELTAFRLPNQTNRLAVQFDPFSWPQVPFISGIEVFERGHRTTPHVHPHAHELFFILAGEGTGFCGEERFPVAAGDVVVFRPGAEHGIDNGSASRMYCLELMVPNEAFAEFVRAGEDTGQLSGDELCVLAAIGCR